ncbi:MAG: hypothetical protein ACYS26_19490 [Planctomycetota bacterium]
MGRSDASTGDAAVPGAADAAEAGGLVHPFPPRKQPAVTSNDGASNDGASSDWASRAEASEDAAGGSVLGAFLNRWRDAPQAQPADVSAAERSGAMASRMTASNAMAWDVADEAPSAIRQLAEWAQQTRATQAGIRSEVEPSPTRDEERPAPAEPREPERQHKSRGKRAQAAPAAENAPPPRTSGRASELLDHWAAQGAAPTDVRPTAPPNPPPNPAHQPNPGSATQPPSGHGVVGKAPAGGTPLGRLPGGERCGPSLEALAFAGVTCLEDLTQAPARQLAERSGLPYTEVLRLQFLAERYLSRS